MHNHKLHQKILEVVGEEGCITNAADMEPYLHSWRDGWAGRSPMVVRPKDTAQVAQVVRFCLEARAPVVPQGGNTGVTGGGQPRENGGEIVLSTARMDKILGIDTENDTITVEAGCVLENVQRAAQEVNRLFPLSLAAQGSCQIGGNLSTNAGGTQVIRYGNARALTLGLEVVLSDGRIWNGMRGLRKDNAGYDLKQLFIGAEGTLGIITAAVLQLFPRPSERQVALLALPNPHAAVATLSRAKSMAGDGITAFELIQRSALELSIAHDPQARDPFDQAYPWYVLIELSGVAPSGHTCAVLEQLLEEAAGATEVLDAVIAQSESQAGSLWRLRENISEGQKRSGVSIKHDISVPISKIDSFLARAGSALTKSYPGIRLVAFGHVGDGNIHFNPMQPQAADGSQWKENTEDVNRIVHDLVHELGGSISAEHGIGQLRIGELERYKPAIDLDLMAHLKNLFDPYNIMNPGKLVRAEWLQS